MTGQILDAAEHLFSRHGLYGVTLKDVASRVGVHHTLLNYYFNDKKTLFDAVIARRAEVTSELRMKALDEYEAASGGRPTVEGALHSSIPTWTSTSRAGRSGRITVRSARLRPIRPTAPNSWTSISTRWCCA